MLTTQIYLYVRIPHITVFSCGCRLGIDRLSLDLASILQNGQQLFILRILVNKPAIGASAHLHITAVMRLKISRFSIRIVFLCQTVNIFCNGILIQRNRSVFIDRQPGIDRTSVQCLLFIPEIVDYPDTGVMIQPLIFLPERRITGSKLRFFITVLCFQIHRCLSCLNGLFDRSLRFFPDDLLSLLLLFHFIGGAIKGKLCVLRRFFHLRLQTGQPVYCCFQLCCIVGCC